MLVPRRPAQLPSCCHAVALPWPCCWSSRICWPLFFHTPPFFRGMGNCVSWCGWRRQPTATRLQEEPAVGALGGNEETQPALSPNPPAFKAPPPGIGGPPPWAYEWRPPIKAPPPTMMAPPPRARHPPHPDPRGHVRGCRFWFPAAGAPSCGGFDALDLQALSLATLRWRVVRGYCRVG